ncbi:hypothetical protein QE385_000725 [Sphingomonas sp. SORGH_AS 950]|nr:hypothetical protein [Sphingomonas sp. SORGH_AS_0950]
MAFGPIGASLTLALLRHFCTVVGLERFPADLSRRGIPMAELI